MYAIIGVLGNALLLCMNNNLSIDGKLINIVNDTMHKYPHWIDELYNLQSKVWHVVIFLVLR